MKRLILKAASRLRRKNYFCKKIKISLKSQCGKQFEKNKKFSRTSDSLTLLEEVDFIWKNILKTHKIKIVKKISVILYDLEFTDSPQMNFLESFDDKFQDSLKKRKRLSRTMDKINTRFGKDSITIGSISKKISRFSGTKIAFTRIPDISEFYE